MRSSTVVGTLLALALAGPAPGQDKAREEAAEPQERPRPVRTIRVLQSPHDLASFYTARPGHPGITPPHDPAYALASFYRSRPSGAPAGPPPGPWIWAAFWAHGYGAPRPTPFVGYRSSIGEHGDIFLAVPFLAPVGPLSGAFAGY